MVIDCNCATGKSKKYKQHDQWKSKYILLPIPVVAVGLREEDKLPLEKRRVLLHIGNLFEKLSELHRAGGGKAALPAID